MNKSNRILPLVAIMAVTVTAAIGITFQGLYRAALEQQRAMLVETVTTQARLIEAVARFDAVYSVNDHPEGAVGATLSQIRDAYFPETGPDTLAELVLARKAGDQIAFLSARRRVGNQVPETLPFSGTLAAPMRLALSGRSGTVVGPDYKGTPVLAAYEPVGELNLGLVAKADLSEIRAPFLKSFALDSSIALMILGIGTWLFLKLHHRFSDHVEESEASLREAQRIAHIGHWTLNPVTQEITGSDELFRIFGLTREQATLEAFVEVLHPEDRERGLALLQRSIDFGERWSLEHRLLDSEGKETWVHSKANVITDKTGKTVSLFGTVQDITKRKQSEQRFALVCRASPDGMGISRLSDGRLIEVNPAFEKMSGVPRKVAIEGTTLEFWADPHARKRYADLLVSEGSVRNVEIQGRRSSGEVFDALISAELIEIDGEPHAIWIVKDITERKQMEKALRMSEERYRTMIESSHEFIFCKDRDGRYHSLNLNTAIALGGTCIEDIQGKTDYDLLPEEQAAKLRTMDKTVMERGEVIEAEETLPGPDGQIHTFLSRKWPTYDDSGKVSGIGCFAIDISKHKQMEEELREREQRFRKLADQAPIMIGETDASGHITFLNKTWLDFRGKTLEEEEGWAWAAGLHPDDRERTIKEIESCIEKLAPYSIEYRIQDRHGKYHWMLDTAAPRFDANGKPQGYIGTAINITGHKELELALEQARDYLQERVEERTAELQASRESYAQAEAIAHIGHWEWQMDRNRVTRSDECYRILGRTQEEMGNTYKAWKATVHPEDRERVVEVVEESFRSGSPFRCDYRILRPDGKTVRHVEARGTVTLDPETGSPLHMMGTILDVTERKKIESELREAQRMEALGNLAGGIAHSLNNLLLPILALSALTRDDLPEESAAREHLTRVIEAGERAQDLTNRILTFSRRDDPQQVDVDIHEIVARAVGLLQSTIPSTIRLQTKLQDNTGIIYADPAQIESVVMNLASNAVDALEGKTGEITISLARERTAGNGSAKADAYAVLKVGDDGAGMPRKVRERVLDPFYTTKEVGEGTGLGLSMAHGIISAHGGVLELDSAPGNGTTVTVRIPLKEGNEVTATA